MYLWIASLSLAMTFSAVPGYAQDNGYAPPPMFDDMTPPMVRPQTDNGYIVEPKASPQTVLPPDAPDARPVVVPRVSVDPDTPQPPVNQTTTTTGPVPQKPVVKPAAPTTPSKMRPIIDPRDVKGTEKPVTPNIEKPSVKKPAAPVPKPPQKPVIKEPVVNAPVVKPPEKSMDMPAVPATPTPPPAPVKEHPKPKAEAPAPKMQPVKRDPHESAIQGPKTMPALPTQKVDVQATFNGDEEKGATILERHQQEAREEKQKEEIKPVVPAPKANVKPADFDKSGQEALKKTIPFQQGQIGLSSEQIDPIAAAVVKQLDAHEREEWRVQIRAYATPYGTGVSSDRRIALSRALSLRSALIAQGVPAARIDVLAEGLQSDNPKQPDRIDLYMYGPEAN